MLRAYTEIGPAPEPTRAPVSAAADPAAQHVPCETLQPHSAWVGCARLAISVYPQHEPAGHTSLTQVARFKSQRFPAAARTRAPPTSHLDGAFTRSRRRPLRLMTVLSSNGVALSFSLLNCKLFLSESDHFLVAKL